MLSDRWFLFAILFLSRTTIAYQFQSVASVGSLLVESRLLDFATLGLLIGCYMLPGVALSLPGGLLDQRFGARRTVILGLLLMALGGVAMAAESVPLLFAGRLVGGAGAAILNVVLARTVSQAFPERELAVVMGAFVASWPLGIALSLISVPPVMVALGWAAVTIVSALPSLICLVLFATAYRKSAPSDAAAPASLRLNLSRRELLLATAAGAIWGLYNAAYVIVVAALPEFFVELGYSLPEAAAWASVLGWALVLTLPLGGYLAMRLGRATLLMIVCFLLIAAAIASLALTSATTPSVVLLAATFGLPAGLIMAVPALVLAADKRAGGMGVYFTVFYLAVATLPGVAGLVREHTGQVGSPLLFGAACLAMACLAALCLARLRDGELSPRSTTA